MGLSLYGVVAICGGVPLYGVSYGVVNREVPTI